MMGVMTTLRAHFDGKVLIPDDPVDLPKDRPLEIYVIPLGENCATGQGIPGTPAGVLAAQRKSPRLAAEDVAELERSIADGKLPVKNGGIFDGEQ
ncbi:MAG: hypothetical protein JWM97_293 [Phycisphaerales bacterium]|nr:hypothetical protein [Phycisphaerales bacterium]